MRDLILASEAGELRLQHPFAYQEKNGARQAVDSRFVVKNDHQVVFALGSYDRSRELVIDPSISFATFFGGGGTNGSGEETGLGVALDASGNAYVVGTTNSSTVLPGSPKLLGTPGDHDCYVVEFNPSGVIVFTTIFGGSLDDLPQAVAVDGTGIYVAGLTQSNADFPVTTGAAQTTFGGSGPYGDGDAFVVKLTTDGSSITWATYLGGKDLDVAYALAVDSSQNVFVVGQTYSATGFPVSHPLPQGTTYNGMGDGFVTEVQADGSKFLMSSYIGGTQVDVATGVSWNLTTGNVYVSGGTQSPDLPFTAGAFQQQCGTGTGKNCNQTAGGQYLDDGFVAAFSPSSTTAYVYLTYLGGGGIDDALAITTDSTGNAYLTGKTASGGSTHFPVMSPYQSTLNGVQNAFVTQLKADGSALIYSTYLGGGGSDKGLGIALDAFNNAYVTGQTTSTAFPTANPTQLAFGGGNSTQFDSDAFVSELNWNGTTLSLPFSTYIGGSGDEDILGGFVTLDSTGNIFVVGDTNSTNFPIQASSSGIADSSLNGGLGSQPICDVLNRQTGKTIPVVCPDAFVELYTANTNGLLVTLAGTGAGTVSSSPAGITCPGVGTCSASFANPTTVTLTETANANSVFAGWSGGGCSGMATTCTVTLNSNQFVTATFTAVRANISVTIVGTGSVTSSPAGISCPSTCVASFAIGAQVKLTATPGTNFVFAGWSGGGCSGTGTCTMTVNSDQSVTATFTQPSVSVTVVGSGTVTSSPAGINCPGTCIANFAVGTKLTLTATAAKGFTFTGWSGGGCSGTGTCSITLNSNEAVTATFQVPSFTITATPLSPSSVSPGGSATSTVTIAPSGGFDVTSLTLSCAVTPAGSLVPGCKLGAISGDKSTLTVSTTPVSAALAPFGFHPSGLFYAMFLPIGGMAFLGAGLGGDSRKKRLLGLLLVCLVISGLVFMVACGGGSSTSTGTGGGSAGTPAGKYTITVKGTATGVTEGGTPPSLTLTVQ